MIINTGARTDTVNYYSKWRLNRFREGYVLTRNPLFPGKITQYVLTPILKRDRNELADRSLGFRR